MWRLYGVEHDHYESIEKAHGRVEVRKCWAVEGEAGWIGIDKDWKNVRMVAMINRERTIRGKSSTETSYYITSLSADAGKIAGVARSHWGVENSLHWVLDVTMNEDMNRIRKDHAPENFAVLGRIAVSMVNQVKGKKSVRGCLLSAGWNTNFLEQILVGHRQVST